MEPLTMAALTAGAYAAKSIPSAISNFKTDKSQKKRLEELERLEEMNALGLTEEQFANYRQRLGAPVLQAQKRTDAEMRRLATPSAQPARQLQQAMLAQQNREAMEAQIASNILGVDLKRQAQQQQEMKDLRAAQDERKLQQINAVTDPILAGAEAYIQADTMNMLFNQPPAKRVETVAQTTGASQNKITETFPILQKQSGPDGLFPQGFEAANRMSLLNEQTGLSGLQIPPPPSLPTATGFRPQNILTEMGMGITGQMELARRGFDQQDMIRVQQVQRQNPNMSIQEFQEFLEEYLIMNGMGGL